MEKVADIPEAVLGAMDIYDWESKVWQEWIFKEYDMELAEITSAKYTLRRLDGALHKEHMYTGMGYKDLVL